MISKHTIRRKKRNLSDRLTRKVKKNNLNKQTGGRRVNVEPEVLGLFVSQVDTPDYKLEDVQSQFGRGLNTTHEAFYFMKDAPGDFYYQNKNGYDHKKFLNASYLSD